MVYFISMFSDEVRQLLVEVISSWQVLAVTFVLIIYFFLVNHVARVRQRRRPSVPRRAKAKVAPADIPPPPSDDDDLGLEEDAVEEEVDEE